MLSIGAVGIRTRMSSQVARAALLLAVLVNATAAAGAVDVRARLGTDSAAILRPCIGGGTELPFILTIDNADTDPLEIDATLSLSAGLQVVPNSCQATQPTCNIVNASTVDYDTTVAAQTIAEAGFLARVGNGLPPGTPICVVASVVVNGGEPIVLERCLETTQTRNCGISAPTASPLGLGLLLVALFAAGVVLVRRRAL